MKIEPVDPKMVRTDGARLRELQEDTVKALMESMVKVGLLEPILTFRPKDGGFVALISGLHRLEAARRLKWESIPAVVYDNPSEIDREMMEIDENLVRAELSEAERYAHEKRKAELYDASHQGAKARSKAAVAVRRGEKGATMRASGLTSADRPYSEAEAERQGVHPRTISRRVRIAKRLGDTRLSKIKGTSLDTSGEMRALERLPEDEIDRLINRAAAGEKVSARPPKPDMHVCECRHCGRKMK